MLPASCETRVGLVPSAAGVVRAGDPGFTQRRIALPTVGFAATGPCPAVAHPLPEDGKRIHYSRQRLTSVLRDLSTPGPCKNLTFFVLREQPFAPADAVFFH